MKNDDIANSPVVEQLQKLLNEKSEGRKEGRKRLRSSNMDFYIRFYSILTFIYFLFASIMPTANIIRTQGSEEATSTKGTMDRSNSSNCCNIRQILGILPNLLRPNGLCCLLCCIVAPYATTFTAVLLSAVIRLERNRTTLKNGGKLPQRYIITLYYAVE